MYEKLEGSFRVLEAQFQFQLCVENPHNESTTVAVIPMWESDDLSMADDNNGMSMADDNNGNGDESDSFRPMDMSFGFMEEDPQVLSTSTYCNGPAMESDVIDGSKPHNIADLEDQYQILKSYISCACSVSERTLRNETVKALEMAMENCAPCVRKHDDEDLTCRGACQVHTVVMNHLRQAGYNAAICRSQFKYMAGGFPRGGYYLYMDVILRSSNSRKDLRLFVDLDFRTHFEIARPTREYSALLGLVPKIYIGRGDTLQSIIKIMCEGVKNSLKRKGMHLPPWRKYKYMHSMWFAPYNRTTELTLDPCFDGKIVEWKSAWQDWEPPAVAANPATEMRRSKVSGLARALKEAHLTSFPADFVSLSVF